jgi:hypothetical protein
MLFGETVAVYCENLTEHTDTMCGQNAEFGMVKRVVYTECPQEERSIFWEVIVPVIPRKKVYMNMCPIKNGFRYLARNIFLPSLSAITTANWRFTPILMLKTVAH